jgi:hypothetical protein
MRTFMRYPLFRVPTVLAMGLVIGTGLGLAVGARPVAERGAVIQHVDRTHKGDRLDLPATVGIPSVPQRQMALPEGCEPAFSPLVSAGRSFTGRCIS